MMDRVDTLLAERECERLTHRYCRFADGGEASRLGELFTEDGLFSVPGMTLEGRAAITARFAEREALTDLQTVHVCSAVDVEVLSDATAQGRVTLCLFRRWREAGSRAPVSVTVPALVATYEDAYRRVGGEWLFSSRVQRVVFADPADPGWTRPRLR